MADIQLDNLAIDIIARTDQLERAVKAAQAQFTTEADRMTRASNQMRQRMEADSKAIGASFKGLAASLAAGFSVREVVSMADSYTRFTNQLKVAGLEGSNLAGTQQKLFEVAQRNGVELEAVGTLYSRAAQNQKELGASTTDLISLTRAVSASLRISGTSTTEASGALLQLGQALGSPRVQAEEFNSLLDTMQPLLRQASKYIDGTGSSLSGLTQKIKDQSGPGVSNVQLFRAITRAMADLEKQAASATLTIGGAFTNLSNAITKFVGETDKANGATATITGALNLLAENLDTVTEALSLLSVVMLGRFVSGMVAGTAATAATSTALFALEARAAGAATSMEALSLVGGNLGKTLLAAVGGTVGAAVLALGVGIYALTRYTEGAANVTEEYEAKVRASAKADEVANDIAMKLTTARGAERQAVEAVARAEVDRAKKTMAAAKADVDAAKAALAKARSLQAAQDAAAASAGGTVPGATAGIMRLTGARGVNQAQNNLNNQQKLLDDADARLAKLESSLGSSQSSTSNSANSKDLAKHQKLLADLEKLKATASGKELATINKKIAREQSIIGNLNKGVSETAAIAAASGTSASNARSTAKAEHDRKHALEEIDRSNVEELRARLDLATSAEARADLQQQILAAEKKQRVDEVKNDKSLSAAQRKALLGSLDRLYGGSTSDGGEITVQPGLLTKKISQDKQEQLNREALETAQASSRNEEDLLRSQADLVSTRAQRREIELKLLDLAYEQQRLEQQAIIDSATSTQAQKDIAKARLAALGQLQGYDTERVNRQHESPIEQRRRQVRDTAANINDTVENIELNAVDKLSDGLGKAATDFLHLGGVAGDVLNSIIDDFVKLIAQQAIFGSGGLLGGIGGGGGGLGGLLGGLGKFLGISGARAAGGPVTSGQTYLVGEKGPELFTPASSGGITPNHQLNTAAVASMNGVRASVATGGTYVTQVLKLDLNGAVMTEAILAQMNQMAQEAAVQGAQGGRALAARDLKAMSRPRM